MPFGLRSRRVEPVLFAVSVLSGGVSACSSDAKPSGPTWYRDVQPIVQAHCAACHDAGGPGPVNLTFPPSDPGLYEMSRSGFGSIVAEVDFADMPYWPADTACRHYVHERRLSDAEVHTMDSWLASGAQRGDPNDAPAPPVPTPLERVDLELAVTPGYTPKKVNGTADDRCFVLDPALSAARDVIGFNVVPGSKRAQHAVLYAMPLAAAQTLDQADADLGYGCFGDADPSATVVGEFVPGVPAQQYPDGTGIRLPAGTGLVLKIQYNLQTGPAELDSTHVQLEFSDSPVPHPARFEAMQNVAFSIPANATGFKARASFQATAASTLYGVAPRLQAYGRTAKMSLSQAAGSQCLIDIANWDRIWEQAFFFANPGSFSLAPGDSIKLDCSWDNSDTAAIVPGNGSMNEACVGNAYLADD